MILSYCLNEESERFMEGEYQVHPCIDTLEVQRNRLVESPWMQLNINSFWTISTAPHEGTDLI